MSYIVDYKSRKEWTDSMIKLEVELQDLNGDWPDKTITLPCNLRSELNDQAEYIIMSCEPDIPLPKCDDIGLLNSIIEEINSVNPDMTAEYLGILLIASGLDISDETFVRRASSNSFMFKDLSNVQQRANSQETAAYYLVTELEIPFEGADAETIWALSDKKIADYVNWEEIWTTYSVMGFSVIEDSGLGDGDLYLVYWKR